jgi:hypothetical protein
MHDMKLTTVVLGALVLGACGGGSAFEGVYEVTAWTDNDTGCDAEGASILELESQTTFYIKLENFFGEFLNVKFCDDTADCQELAGDADTINIGRWFFEDGGDDGWTEGYYSGSAFGGDTCEGDYVETALSPSGEDGVRVEVRRTEAGGFAPDSDGFCDDDDGRQAAEGQPCTGYEVMTAGRVGDL